MNESQPFAWVDEYDSKQEAMQQQIIALQRRTAVLESGIAAWGTVLQIGSKLAIDEALSKALNK